MTQIPLVSTILKVLGIKEDKISISEELKLDDPDDAADILRRNESTDRLSSRDKERNE